MLASALNSSKNSVESLLSTLDTVDPTTLENVLKYATKYPRTLGNVLLSDLPDHTLILLFAQVVLEKKSVATHFGDIHDDENDAPKIVHYYEYQLASQDCKIVELSNVVQPNRDTIEGTLMSRNILHHIFINGIHSVPIKMCKKPNSPITSIQFALSYSQHLNTIVKPEFLTLIEEEQNGSAPNSPIDAKQQTTTMTILDNTLKTGWQKQHIQHVQVHITSTQEIATTSMELLFVSSPSFSIEMRVHANPTHEQSIFVITNVSCK